MFCDQLSMAMAAHNSGGLVIAQVSITQSSPPSSREHHYLCCVNQRTRGVPVPLLRGVAADKAKTMSS